MMKFTCWLVIIFNSLIFVFFIIAIKKGSLVFFAIIFATFVYTIIKKDVLNRISGELSFFERQQS